MYDKIQTSIQDLSDEVLLNTLSFGPALLEDFIIAGNLNNINIEINIRYQFIQSNDTGIGAVNYRQQSLRHHRRRQAHRPNVKTSR